MIKITTARELFLVRLKQCCSVQDSHQDHRLEAWNASHNKHCKSSRPVLALTLADTLTHSSTVIKSRGIHGSSASLVSCQVKINSK